MLGLCGTDDGQGRLHAKVADFGLHAIVQATDADDTVQKLCGAVIPSMRSVSDKHALRTACGPAWVTYSAEAEALSWDGVSNSNLRKSSWLQFSSMTCGRV